MRCIVVDCREHHDDVTWAQGGVGTEAGQQLVVQDLYFALWAVGDVEAHGAVLRQIDLRPQLTGFGKRAQFEDIVLQLLEQCCRLAFAEQVDASIAECALVAAWVIITVEQVDVVAALFAPGGQQGVGVLVQGLVIQLHGHALLALLALVLVAQQVLVGDDVRPVMATRVVHTQ
ncbi:hypothetical protein D3C79_647040 [compost metagenome]